MICLHWLTNFFFLPSLFGFSCLVAFKIRYTCVICKYKQTQLYLTTTNNNGHFTNGTTDIRITNTGYPVVNDPLYNHEVFGPLKGRGGDIGGKTDEELVRDLINIHNAENWLGIDGDCELSLFKTMKADSDDGLGSLSGKGMFQNSEKHEQQNAWNLYNLFRRSHGIFVFVMCFFPHFLYNIQCNINSLHFTYLAKNSLMSHKFCHFIHTNLYDMTVLSDDDSENISREASPCSESPQPISMGYDSPLNNNVHSSVMASTSMPKCNTTMVDHAKVCFIHFH